MKHVWSDFSVRIEHDSLEVKSWGHTFVVTFHPGQSERAWDTIGRMLSEHVQNRYESRDE